MKNKLFQPAARLFCTLFLLVSAHTAFGVTGSIQTEQFHNTGATANSLVTYQVVLSNGWSAANSSVSALTLQNDASTVVYTHSGSGTPYGVIHNLVPGHYKFAGTITTTDENGKFVSVSVSGEIWVGNKVQWENCFDMEHGASQYALKRSAATTGQTYSYAQSFNTLASGAEGWIEMSKLNANGNDSHVFWVLEPLADPRTFDPANHIHYVEFYNTNASTYVIRVKYRNSGGTWQTTNLSTVQTDKIRFYRTSAGTCTLQKNNSQTAAFTFPTNITGALKITVLGKQLNDQADQIASSYAYPNTDYPITTAFNSIAHTNTGNLTVRIAPLSGFTSPYNYFVSDQPIADMKTVYRYFKDSLYPDLDSAAFFTGSGTLTTYTSNELPAGTCYAAAFDSKGVRIFSNTYDLLPPVSYDWSSGMSNSYNEFLGTAPMAFASLNNFITHEQNGRIVYYLTGNAAPQAFGVLETADKMNAGASIDSKLKYGFYVEAGTLYTVVNGTRTSWISAKTGTAIELSFENGSVVFRSENNTYTVTAPSTYTYKSGIMFRDWGTRIRHTGVLISALPFPLLTGVDDNACGKNSGDIRITYPTSGFFGGSVSGMSLQLKNVTDETNITNVGSVNTTLFDDLPLGVYSLEGPVTVAGITYTVKRLIYLGSKVSWDNISDLTIVQWPGGNTTSALGNGTVNAGNPAKAISSNKLAPQTAGWIAVTPIVSYSASTLLAKTAFSLTEGPQMNSLGVPDPSMPSVHFSGGVAWVTIGFIGNIPVMGQLAGYVPNTPLLVTRNASGIVKYRQNYSVLRTVPNYTNGRWKPAMIAKIPNTGLLNCVSSFQCAPVTTDIYAQLKYELDGYYHIMKNGRIRFVFDQEYNSADLTFNIYNGIGQLYRTQADFPALATTNGMNYLTLDVTGDHCIGAGFFYLEVINSKNEKMYLRFYNDYSGCAVQGENNDPGQ